MPDTQEMIRQHQELVALCEKLDEAVRRRRARSEIYKIMDDVIACTVQHFEAEERLMAEAGYPEIEGHKAMHRELLTRTRKFRKRLDLYGEEEFTEWFNHWPFPFILAHIRNADHQIADHVTDNNRHADNKHEDPGARPPSPPEVRRQPAVRRPGQNTVRLPAAAPA